MKVTVFGAANEVTGSCYMLQTDRSTILVDCGMFQGPRKLERLNFIPKGLPVGTVEAVLLTHGHLDHCG
ncbi:MAG: MBL fold metallo-hydrolase, partial [Cyanobacteria bacterium]|nr:MBL fold metallo-hydrolase [Cyanobacteriota bacterium]